MGEPHDAVDRPNVLAAADEAATAEAEAAKAAEAACVAAVRAAALRAALLLAHAELLRWYCVRGVSRGFCSAERELRLPSAAASPRSRCIVRHSLLPDDFSFPNFTTTTRQG